MSMPNEEIVEFTDAPTNYFVKLFYKLKLMWNMSNHSIFTFIKNIICEKERAINIFKYDFNKIIIAPNKERTVQYEQYLDPIDEYPNKGLDNIVIYQSQKGFFFQPDIIEYHNYKGVAMLTYILLALGWKQTVTELTNNITQKYENF